MATKNTKKTAVVLFGAHRWGRQEVITLAKRADLVVYVAIGFNEQTPDESLLTDCTRIIVPSENQPEFFKHTAAQLGALYHESWYVLALDDFSLASTGRLASFCPNPPFESAAGLKTFEKGTLRSIWNTYCSTHLLIPALPVEFCFSGQQPTFPPPYIVKPNSYAGSIGISEVNTIEALEKRTQALQSLLVNESANPEMKGIDFDDKIIIEASILRAEHFNQNAEYSVHMFSWNGAHQLIGVSEKQLHPDSYIELGHQFPANTLSDNLEQLLTNASTDLLDELNVNYGISNWEYIITPDEQIALVEGQLRPSGDNMMTLIEKSSGVNPLELLFQSFATCLDPDIPNPTATSLITWLNPTSPIQSIEQLKSPDPLPPGIQLLCNLGSLQKAVSWQETRNWYDRYIAIVSVGSTVTESQQLMEQVINELLLIGIDELGRPVTSKLKNAVLPSTTKATYDN